MELGYTHAGEMYLTNWSMMLTLLNARRAGREIWLPGCHKLNLMHGRAFNANAVAATYYRGHRRYLMTIVDVGLSSEGTTGHDSRRTHGNTPRSPRQFRHGLFLTACGQSGCLPQRAPARPRAANGDAASTAASSMVNRLRRNVTQFSSSASRDRFMSLTRAFTIGWSRFHRLHGMPRDELTTSGWSTFDLLNEIRDTLLKIPSIDRLDCSRSSSHSGA